MMKVMESELHSPRQTPIPTENIRGTNWADTPIRSLWLLDPSLETFEFTGQLRVTIGRKTGCNWQVLSPHISRHHAVLHAFQGKAKIVRHADASQPVRINGLDIGRQPFTLEPWISAASAGP